MNALEQLKTILGTNTDTPTLATVIKTNVDSAECHTDTGKKITVIGSYSVGTQLIIKNNAVQSVVKQSGMVIYE